MKNECIAGRSINHISAEQTDKMKQRFLSHKQLFAAALIFLLVNVCMPVSGQEGLGYSGAFMRVGVGSRAGSMGDAYVAAAAGPEAIYWNPAGVVSNSWAQLTLTQRRFSFDRNFNFIGGTLPIANNLSLGIGWAGFRTGNLEARSSNTTDPESIFSDDEHAFTGIVSYRYSNRLKLGFGVKGLTQKLFDQSASGYSAVVGLLIRPTESITIGATLQDLYSRFNWEHGLKEKLPSTFMLGLAFKASQQVLITLDYHHTDAHAIYDKQRWQQFGKYKLGSEFYAMPNLPVRVGVTDNAFSAGAGFKVPVSGTQLQLDYHFATQEGINKNVHAVSLTFDFGFLKRRSGFDDLHAKSGLEKKDGHVDFWITVEASTLNVRSGPGIKYSKLDAIHHGESYRTLEMIGDWYRIKLNNDELGWVHRDFVKIK